MKVKIGKKITTLPKDVVISHMANLLASRAVILRQERDFKSAFLKYKNLCGAYLRQNKKFVYYFGEENWLEDFLKYEIQLRELLLQEIYFKFSDNSTWSISLNDIANIKILQDGLNKDFKNNLLSDPVSLASWAQEKLTWEQVKNFAIIRDMSGKEDVYEKEWMSVPKKVVIYNYETKK